MKRIIISLLAIASSAAYCQQLPSSTSESSAAHATTSRQTLQPGAPNPAEFDRQTAQVQENMHRMREQMAATQQTRDQQQRQRPLQEHGGAMQNIMDFMGPGMIGSSMMGHGPMMGMSMLRHRFVMMNGLGPEYAAKSNPLPLTEQTIAAGKKLFAQNCARCHGANGQGDGPDGANLSPPPANVAAASKMPMASDSYLFWTISEGGVPVGSAMPPFKKTLKEDDIWRIVAYLRAL